MADLVGRARALRQTYTELRWEVLEVVGTPGQVAVAFRIHGRHTGPLATPLGTVAPTGRPIELRVIDILTISAGKISRLWMTADELGLLSQPGAVALTAPARDE